MPSPYKPRRARVPQHVRGELGDRAAQVRRRGLAQCPGEGIPADRPAPLGREQHRAGQLPVVAELAADVLDPPDQQRPGIPQHRHHPLPRPGAARALAQPHVDLAHRAVAEVQVLQPQPAQLGQPQPGLGGQPGHRVMPGRGQPLARRGQLAAPRSEERCQRLRGRRDPDVEVAGVAGPVALIDRRGDHPAGQLVDLAPVAGLQEAEEQVDRPGLAAPGLRRLVPLRLAQEPVGVRGLDFPGEHARVRQELLHRGDLAADRAVGHAVGQPGQHVLRHQVLLIGRRLARCVERPRGPQVPDHSQRHPAPRLQQSRTRLAIAENRTGKPTRIQGSASDTPTRLSCHLTCHKRRPAPARAKRTVGRSNTGRPICSTGSTSTPAGAAHGSWPSSGTPVSASP